MAHGYTFERAGDGYRFYLDSGGVQTRRPNPIMTGSGPFWLAGGVFVLGFLTGMRLLFIVALLILGWGIVSRTGGRRAATAPKADQGRAGPTLLVTQAAITPAEGQPILVSRVNEIAVRNKFDQYLESRSNSRSYYKAGSGLNALDAIADDRHRARARTRYFVTVKHGPSETTIAEELDENGATGLVADIRRVLRGENLD